MDSSQELQDQVSQQNAATVQQSRSDLQPTGSTGQSSTVNPNQSSGSLSQDSLSAPTLRVGDTTTTVSNTTKTNPPISTATTGDYTWLLLILPLMVAVLLFWPSSRRQSAQSAEAPIMPAQVPVPQKANKPKKKSKKDKKSGKR